MAETEFQTVIDELETVKSLVTSLTNEVKGLKLANSNLVKKDNEIVKKVNETVKRVNQLENLVENYSLNSISEEDLNSLKSLRGS